MLRTVPRLEGAPLPTEDPGRVCASCNTILRQTNLTDTCGACQLRAAPEEEPATATPDTSPYRAQILDALPGNAARIIERTGLSRDVVYTALCRMTRRGLVVRSGTRGGGCINGGGGYVYRRPDA